MFISEIPEHSSKVHSTVSSDFPSQVGLLEFCWLFEKNWLKKNLFVRLLLMLLRFLFSSQVLVRFDVPEPHVTEQVLYADHALHSPVSEVS